MGESRYYLGKKRAYLIGFIVSFFIFLVTWYQADWWILILVSLLGATGALIGEVKKLKHVDDDFMIQILPALLLLLVWQGGVAFGVCILPPKMILPI
jgi:uncharacterized membrane protein